MNKKQLFTLYIILIIGLVFTINLKFKYMSKFELNLDTIKPIPVALQNEDESITEEEYMEKIYKIKDTGENTYTIEYDFFVKDNEKIKLKLYGKKFEVKEEYYSKYGINKIEIYKNKKIIQTIEMKQEDFMENETDYSSDEEYYTESFALDGRLTIFDINFDGYLDIGIISTYGNSGEFHYWFVWNSETENYDYVGNLDLEKVDKENKLICDTKKSGGFGEYSSSYYSLNYNKLKTVKLKKQELQKNGEFLVQTFYYTKQENDLIAEVKYTDLDDSIKELKLYGKIKDYSTEYSETYSLLPEKIEVLKENKLIQTINLKDFAEYSQLNTYSNISFIDLNFDNYLDFGVCIGVGTFNVEYAYFLWNEKNNKFEHFTNTFTLEVAKDMEETLYNLSKGDGFYDTYYKINENNELEIIKQSNILLDENNRNAEIYKELKKDEEVIVFVDVANLGNDNDRKQLNVYNKKLDDNKYGVYKIEILENKNVIQTILIEDTNTLGIKYAESCSRFSSIDFFDYNSDGYLDMQIILYKDGEDEYEDLQNIYYYWIWDNNTKTYKGTFNVD